MLQKQDTQAPSVADANLNDLAEISSQLGFEIVDIAGFLDTIESKSKTQLEDLDQLDRGAERVVRVPDFGWVLCGVSSVQATGTTAGNIHAIVVS